jgi:hypothetical protein
VVFRLNRRVLKETGGLAMLHIKAYPGVAGFRISAEDQTGRSRVYIYRKDDEIATQKDRVSKFSHLGQSSVFKVIISGIKAEHGSRLSHSGSNSVLGLDPKCLDTLAHACFYPGTIPCRDQFSKRGCSLALSNPDLPTRDPAPVNSVVQM